MSSLVVDSLSFYLSENYFLKGVNNRLSIVLSQPVEDIPLALASLTAVEKSAVSLTASSVMGGAFSVCALLEAFCLWCFVAVIRYIECFFLRPAFRFVFIWFFWICAF